ncbi:protein kinase [Nonomuraea sp. NPDC050643]|uniref:serine/threonine protein kinase n=1 Tax=Nonomuraea sp. NPDC050643 TaxID=3155660 RepID=UPI00340DB8EE
MTVIAERVRGHRLLERAGQDGPWAVHLARATATGADVLVKTLACHQVDKRALKRIVRGFGFPEELARHDGVIPVLEVGATGDGRPYLVTPLHEGLTLAERPGRSLPMPLEQATGLLRAVAGALTATHAAGGVHGRVKPENVVMTASGVALTGYAMSALMSIVELPDGTLPSVHAAPEELEGHPPVPASDVYALASMAYELLAGRSAFALDGPGSTARFVLGVLTETPPPFPPSVPQDLARLLTRALSKDPFTRPTAADLAAAVASAPIHPLLPTEPPPATTGPGLPPATTGASLPATGHPSLSPGDHTGLSPADRPVLPPGDHPSLSGLPAGDRLIAGEAGQPPTARLPLTDVGPPLTARPPMGDGTGPERSGPRELVWTVDPDRSQVRPPAGPQPFLPPPPDAAQPQSPAAAEPGGRSKRVSLFVAGASGLAVLVGVGSVALAMSGRPQTSGAQEQPVAATAAAPSDGAPADTSLDPPPDQPADQPADQSPADATPDVAPTETRPDPATSPPTLRRTTDPAAMAAYRPKSLKLVSDNGTTVTLSWKAVRKSGYPTVIQQAPGDRMMSAATGTTTYTVGGLEPTTGYCFKVGSVVALGQPSSVAWSSALCIRGAAEANPGGQDDEVQPPIVLPLATPPPS